MEGGAAFSCTGPSYVFNAAASGNTTLARDSCCSFVPTCGAFWGNGTAFQCSTGYEYDSTKDSDTTPSTATCCKGKEGTQHAGQHDQ